VHRWPITSTLSLLLVAAVLAACADSVENGATSTAQPSDPEEAGADTSFPSPGAKPIVDVPAQAPNQLIVEDLEAGTGAGATIGSKLAIHYVAVAFSDKRQFASTWEANRPFLFTLGAGDAIKGWDQGLVGMKVGGRRQLVIPPALGYGSAGFPPIIGSNETLVFVVDLLAVS